MKGISISGVGTHLLRELFPECNLIYNTRNMRPSLESLMKVMMKQPKISRALPWAMSKVVLKVWKGTRYEVINDTISFQFYHGHAAVPYDDEKWDSYRKTMHWLKPQVTLAARLALNFAGQTVDFRKHRDDYQMVCDKFWRQKH